MLPFAHALFTAAVVLSVVSTAQAVGPAGQINDTGVSQAADSGGLFSCTSYNTGDSAALPRQDCRFGRDAQAVAGRLTKIGGGAVGFDFTPLDVNGNEIPLTADKKPTSTPACVRDNVTNLIWEVKTGDGGMHDAKWHYVWYDSNFATNGGYPGRVGPDGPEFCGGTVAVGCDTEHFVTAVNSSGYCGTGNSWRLPTRRELLSIVHNGLPTSSISIDEDYFTNARPTTFNFGYSGYGGWPVYYSRSGYLTSDTLRSSPENVWIVGFLGTTGADRKAYWSDNYGDHWIAYSVRLVRDGRN